MPLFDSGVLYFDILSHFPTYACLAASIVLAFSIFWRGEVVVRWGLASLLVAILANSAWLIPYLPIKNDKSRTFNEDLRVAQFNVLLSNRDFDGVIRWLRRVDPDVLVVQEVDTRWVSEISSLSALFPHWVARPRPDNFGIAIFSRYPITQHKEIRLPVYPVPALLTRLDVAGRVVRLAAVHTVPPVSSRNLTARNLSLKTIADWVREEPNTPTLVVGDLNCTPFAAPLRGFLDDSGLKDVRVGRGLHNSWPNGLPALLRIPIDYILHNTALEPLTLTSGPPLGSDHLPLTATYRLSE